MGGCRQEEVIMKFEAVHDIDRQRSEIMEQCINILNYEWPRSEAIRKRGLESSSAELPLNLILWQQFESGPSVIGHSRISKIPSDPEAVFVESVVVHNQLRGKGFGKYLMLKTEEYCRNLGFKTAHLTTHDKQIFYSCCGYKFSEPVCAFGGSSKLQLPKSTSEKSYIPAPSRAPVTAVVSTQSLPPLSCPPPPPPPAPPSRGKIEEKANDKIEEEKLVAFCATVYKVPRLPENAPSISEPLPRLELPPTPLNGKLSKQDISLLESTKMCMKKKI